MTEQVFLTQETETAAVYAALEELTEVRREMDLAKARLTAAEEAAIPEELRFRLAELRRVHQEQLDSLEELAARAERTAKSACLTVGHTVKGVRLQAVYAEGRVAWNDRRLLEYASEGHAEIMVWREAGAASVSIRKVSGG